VVPSTAIPASAVSRKTHTGQGDFDIALPLAGSPGVECRRSTGDSHKMIVSFVGPVTVNGTNPQKATISGTGSVSGVTVNGSTVTIDLTGVGNAQTISVTLLNVNNGATTANVVIPMGVLLGDTTASRTVNSGDAQETRNRSGQLADSTNFRSDVNTDGTVNSGDAFLVRARSGTTLDQP
jgi:hypothetical protein